MFLICLLLWILFNGRITLEILILGIIISAGVYAVSCLLLGFSLEKDKILVARIPGVIKLFGILLAEIVRANLKVIRMVYRRESPKPCYIQFDVSLKSAASRAVLADCITLTPGTITGILDENHYTVHCLDPEMAEGIENSSFVRQLQSMEKKGGSES